MDRRATANALAGSEPRRAAPKADQSRLGATEIGSLHRAIGNRAVARLFAMNGRVVSQGYGRRSVPAGMVQRMAVTSLDNVGQFGLAPSKGPKQLITNTEPKLWAWAYYVSLAANNERLTRTDALLDASTKLGEFGQWLGASGKKFMGERRHRSFETEYERPPTSEKPKKQGALVPPTEERADKDVITPFVLRLSVPYGSGSKKLRLDYQFANSYRGYLVQVKEGDDRDQPTSKAVMVPKKKSEMTHMDPIKFYSNEHEPSGGTKLTEIVNDEETFDVDAMSKLAGESARWQCVQAAAKAGVLTDDLVFYFNDDQADDKGTYWGIPFNSLWLTWTEFGNAYQIRNDTVKTKIKALSKVARHSSKVVREAPQTGRDYAL